MNTTLVAASDNYTLACQAIPDLVKASGRKYRYFYTALGITKDAFQKKLASNYWTPEQLKKMGELL